jgi:hypothetical protein
MSTKICRSRKNEYTWSLVTDVLIPVTLTYRFLDEICCYFYNSSSWSVVCFFMTSEGAFYLQIT